LQVRKGGLPPLDFRYRQHPTFDLFGGIPRENELAAETPSTQRKRTVFFRQSNKAVASSNHSTTLRTICSSMSFPYGRNVSLNRCNLRNLWITPAALFCRICSSANTHSTLESSIKRFNQPGTIIAQHSTGTPLATSLPCLYPPSPMIRWKLR